jgi:hypothetical protein
MLKNEIDIKEKKRRNLSQTIQELRKEYGITQLLLQKTKLETHGH